MAAEERRDLEDIGHLGRGRHLAGLVHIGEHGEARGLPHALQGLEAAIEARAAGGLEPGAVGFVVGRLVYDVQPQAGLQVRQRFRDAQVQVVRLDDARPRDQERGLSEVAHPTVASARSTAAARRRRWASAAPTKLANSGCGRVGRDFSSGWNWQPTYQG